MILTVTPNAAVDKTYRIEGFRLDRVNRPSLTHTVAGGKGVNVARVYQTLGGKAVATGFLGGNNGRIVADALAAERIADEFEWVEEETRLCIAAIDPTTGSQTEINEPGPGVSERSREELLRRVERLLTHSSFEFVVLSGSLPPGMPAGLYADLIGIAKAAGVRSVLDASGDALKAGIEARPWLIKPNRAELESAAGHSLLGEADTREAAYKIVETGVPFVAATMGAQGALVVSKQSAWRSTPPSIEFASAVASGDSFAAAFLWAWTHGNCPGDIASALKLATGAGAANAAVVGAGFCTRESIFALAARTTLIEL